MLRSSRGAALQFNGVSPVENDFLVTRLDPFHDKPYLPMGGPGSAPTVMRTFRRTVTVNNPNQASVGQWSFCISNGPNGYPYIPIANGAVQLNLRNFDNGVGNITGTFDSTYAYGGINTYNVYVPATPNPVQVTNGTHHPFAPCYIVAVDNPIIQFSSTVDTSTGTIGPSNSRNRAIGVAQFGENVYADGPSKLVSVAYEVHMTTSDLYNTGVLTVGRIPQALSTGNMRTGAIGTEPAGNAAITTSSILPINSGDLLLYSGSRQWPAKHGVYAVAPQASSCTPDFDPNPFTYHVRRELSWQSGTSLTGTTTALGVTTATRNGTTTISSTEHFDTVMTMFEGLDPRATLQVTVMLTYETIPSDSPLLRPLARMPMPIRPSILEVLALLSSTIEPFCMVGENASGNFFKKIARAFDAAKNVVNSPVGKAGVKLLKGDMAGAAQSAVGAVVKAVQKQTKKQSAAQNANGGSSNNAQAAGPPANQRQRQAAAAPRRRKKKGKPLPFPVFI